MFYIKNSITHFLYINQNNDDDDNDDSGNDLYLKRDVLIIHRYFQNGPVSKKK